MFQSLLTWVVMYCIQTRSLPQLAGSKPVVALYAPCRHHSTQHRLYASGTHPQARLPRLLLLQQEVPLRPRHVRGAPRGVDARFPGRQLGAHFLPCAHRPGLGGRQRQNGAHVCSVMASTTSPWADLQGAIVLLQFVKPAQHLCNEPATYCLRAAAHGSAKHAPAAAA